MKLRGLNACSIKTVFKFSRNQRGIADDARIFPHLKAKHSIQPPRAIWRGTSVVMPMEMKMNHAFKPRHSRGERETNLNISNIAAAGPDVNDAILLMVFFDALVSY